MADQPSVRLNKVLRELNISLDRAVEFLNQKGIEVDARPTTKITTEVYNTLLDEFETDKSKKVASHEISEEKRKEKENLRIIQEKKEQERLDQIAQRESLKTNKVALEKPKTLGKIDLDALKKPAPALKEVPVPEATEEPAAAVTEEKTEEAEAIVPKDNPRNRSNTFN
jgi:translation initiation factor IF-2